jgi:predicted RNA methylase
MMDNGASLDSYSIGDYGDMIADKARMDPYAYALKSLIRPDSVVLDIGTGAGIHALFRIYPRSIDAYHSA